MTGIDKLSDYLKNFGIKLILDEPMSRHTTFNIGGPVKIMAFPKSWEETAELYKAAALFSVPVLTIGNGSNLLVSDKGLDALVIKTYDGLDSVAAGQDGEITAGAGTPLWKVTAAALKAGLTGLEFAHGIPGTIGGAVYMNAGAYGGEMKDVVTVTRYLSREFEFKSIDSDAHNFGYRKSVFSDNGGMILEVGLKLRASDPELIRSEMDKISRSRREKQPLELPSAGSVFKRPEGYFAGRLIEDAGLRGYRVGGAQVSEKHAGFIVNTGGASCDDVLRLIGHIQDTVQRQSGITLLPELKIV